MVRIDGQHMSYRSADVRNVCVCTSLLSITMRMPKYINVAPYNMNLMEI